MGTFNPFCRTCVRANPQRQGNYRRKPTEVLMPVGFGNLGLGLDYSSPSICEQNTITYEYFMFLLQAESALPISRFCQLSGWFQWLAKCILTLRARQTEIMARCHMTSDLVIGCKFYKFTHAKQDFFDTKHTQ